MLVEKAVQRYNKISELQNYSLKNCCSYVQKQQRVYSQTYGVVKSEQTCNRKYRFYALSFGIVLTYLYLCSEKRDMKDIIDHSGIVESIEDRHVRVRIVQSSACSSCQAKSLCASAESKEKIIDVWDADTNEMKVGDEVKVCASLSMGRNAVMLAFVVPLVLMVVWMIVALMVLKLSEPIAIGGVLGLLIIYYIGIGAMRNKLKRKFAFWIENY